MEKTGVAGVQTENRKIGAENQSGKDWSDNGSKIVQVGKSVENFEINRTAGKIIAQNLSRDIGVDE